MVRLSVFQTGKLIHRSTPLLLRTHHTTSEPCIPNLAKLKERTLLRIKGRDSGKFLQGIVTNDVVRLTEEAEKIQYTTFLNSQGRVLFDAFLYAVPGENDEYLIECDHDATNDLVSNIKQYKLRAKFEITDASKEFEVWALFSCSKDTVSKVSEKSGVIAEKDPRNDALGIRMVIPWNRSPANLLGIKECSKVDSVVYREHRYILGIAEGIKEIPTGSSLPLEYNLALLNGVSFSKGCYIGQELTARTHHTGTIRKRIMPLSLKDINVSKYPEFLPQTSLKTDSGQSAGKLSIMSGQYGLGLLRLKEVLQSKYLIANNVDGNEVILSTLKPEWWPEDLKY